MTCVLVNGNLFSSFKLKKMEGTEENVQRKIFYGNEKKERVCRNAITSPEKQCEFLLHGRTTSGDSHYELFAESESGERGVV